MQVFTRIMLAPFRGALLALALALALVFALALALAACGATSTNDQAIDTTGWQTYQAPHFRVSFAPTWHEKTVTLKSTASAQSATGYAFYSSDGSKEVAVIEEDGVSASAVRSLCAANGTPITVAGLPMRYVLAATGVRDFTFVTAKHTVYTLVSQGPAKEPQNQALYDAVMATFKPDDTTSAC